MSSEKNKETNSKLGSDGKHTSILNEDGKTEWVELNDALTRNTYDTEDGFVRDGELMKYYENGKLASTVGIDVSKYQGDIDWAKVKAAGKNWNSAGSCALSRG